jgi:hypothetical protein
MCLRSSVLRRILCNWRGADVTLLILSYVHSVYDIEGFSL